MRGKKQKNIEKNLKKVLTYGKRCGRICEQKEAERSVLTVSQGEYGMIIDLKMV